MRRQTLGPSALTAGWRAFGPIALAAGLLLSSSGAGEGQASCWVRMAQPYAGAQHGMSFPLLKGTEVIVTFIDGDPDRPIILGALPDARHPSVVTKDSPSANRIVTVSGIAMEGQDGPARGEG